MRKLLKKAWLWLIIIVVSASVWLIAFYWASQPSSADSFEVWVGAAEDIVGDELSAQLNQICSGYGIKKFTVRNYNPDDYFYPQAFALRARNVEIYILSRDEALPIAETGLFRVIEQDYGQNTLEYDGKTVGVEYTDDYFVFINGTSKKDSELLFKVFNAIINYEVDNEQKG